MAEILIFTKDVQGDDVYKTAKLYKRGMVVTVQEDGWNWGNEELNNPLFRILKIPGVPASNFTSFLSWEVPQTPGVDPTKPDNTMQRRGFKINLDDPSIPKDLQTYLADDTRTQKTIISIITPAAILSLKTSMPAVPDPAVIGNPPNIL